MPRIPATASALALALVLLMAQPVPARQDGTANPVTPPVPLTAQPFDTWLTGVVTEARERGFSEVLIASTLTSLEPLQRVVENDRNQAETVLPFDRYYATRVTAQMVRRGRELARQHRTLLTRIEREYRVPRRVILAIWGMETRYGQVTGRTPVFQALATLAWEPRRAAFFRGELFNALTIVAGGHIEASAMTGSWAGAMGQTQFMPSSYLAHAVDFDRDGRRDIWRSVPDALASIANYLRGYGWEDGLTWGREVRVTATARERIAVPLRTEGCSSRRTMTEYRPLAEWRRLGVRAADGGPLPTATVHAAMADLAGRSYLLYPNYDAILGYNCAHLYALSVARFSDRLQ